jgi:anti-sigma factor RsiW
MRSCDEGERMTCRELIDFLMAYLDGELPADQARVFEEHLHLCPPCEAYLETYREAVRAGRAACAEDDATPAEAPEDLVQAILAARAK